MHGTIEDPATGAHEGFLEMVGEIPGQVRIFYDVSDVNDIAQFLSGDDAVGAQLPAHLATEVVAEPQDSGETVLAGQPSREGPDGIPVESFAGEPELQELDQPDHETEMASENARLRSATEVLKDSMTRMRSRWEDAQDEVRSLEQALDQSTEKQAELLRRLAERATELSTVTAQRDEARRERDDAIRAAEEVRVEATPRLETEIVRLQGLLAEYMARAAQLEEANAHLAHRVEQAEGRSAAACTRVAELEHRLRRFEAASADGTRHAASPRDRQVKTVGGARISTSMTPDKLQALGDLLSRTQAR